MARVIKELCKVRDILISENDKLISNPRNTEGSGLYERLGLQIKEVVKKKYNDKTYELDITSQDLRELSNDIRAVLNRWDVFLNAERNIKEILTGATKGDANILAYLDNAIPVMQVRLQSVKPLIDLLNISESMAVILYLLELASDDKFALAYTERFEKII